jgi:uncharacterized protein YbjQ (UPF0145 family)
MDCYSGQHAGALGATRPLIHPPIPGVKPIQLLVLGWRRVVRAGDQCQPWGVTARESDIMVSEIRSYVKLNEDARRQAIDRMVQNAAAMGANAVTMMRFDSTEMGRSMSEIVAYGTARVVEWPPPDQTPGRA